MFLSKFDTDEIYDGLKTKIRSGEVLTDDDVMRLIILPLTQPDDSRKQELIEDTINLAMQVNDDEQQVFIMAGILTATDMFIDRKYSKMMKEWIKMTKVARLFEEEKIEAVNAAVNAAVTAAVKERDAVINAAVNERDKDVRVEIARGMLSDGDDILKVMKITRLTSEEISKAQEVVGV